MNTRRTTQAALAALAALAMATIAGLLASCGGGGGYSSGGGYMMGPPYYAATSLVSDAGATPYTDANLVNGWGVAFNPQGYVWVADQATARSTLYDGNGIVQSLVVTTPAHPTGIVYNAGTGFVVTQASVSGASTFIFATEDGLIAGWSPSVSTTSSVSVIDGSAAAKSYKGLALAAQGAASFLYASDFHHATVDVFDSSFAPAVAAGGFADASLPAGYAPFGIQTFAGKIYVTYAKQDASAQAPVVGAGLGVVDVFDSSGTLLKQLVAAGGALNAPWGVAMAPAAFGSFGGALLVSNLGDGKINAFDPGTGALLGTLSQANGSPIVIDGLRGIAFGNGLYGQLSTTLFFAAGPAAGAHGLYGRIDAH